MLINPVQDFWRGYADARRGADRQLCLSESYEDGYLAYFQEEEQCVLVES